MAAEGMMEGRRVCPTALAGAAAVRLEMRRAGMVEVMVEVMVMVAMMVAMMVVVAGLRKRVAFKVEGQGEAEKAGAWVSAGIWAGG